MKSTEILLTLSNGSKMPALAFGTGNPPEQIELTKQAVIEAVKAGYRHIDTGWRYNTEHLIGEALQELFKEGVVKREDLFITTKVPPQYHEFPERALKDSLERLQVSYVDLLLQHWPLCWKLGDNGYPIPKDVSANTDLKENDFVIDEDHTYIDGYLSLEKLHLAQPKTVRNIGVSNYSITYLKELLKVCTVKPVVNQFELHPHLSQPKLVQFNFDNGIIPEAYAPLGMQGAPNMKIPLVVEIAKKHNTSPATVLLSYHYSAKRAVVARSVTKKNIISATEYVELSKEELAQLDDFGVKNAKRFNDKFIDFKNLFDKDY